MSNCFYLMYLYISKKAFFLKFKKALMYHQIININAVVNFVYPYIGSYKKVI